MKAIVQDRYGPPDEVLQLREIDRPVPGDREVLVRVRGASVHPDVWHAVTGRPYVMRLIWAGLLRPKNPVPGTDVAGVVEAVGGAVTRFAPGDPVFGETFTELEWRNGGAFAEYVAVPEAALARKPENVSFEEAASVPASGYIAVLNLRSGELVPPGGSVLINGAGGGVGTIAVQLAREWGARVTGVDRTDKLEMIRSLGADEVVDYTREDVTRRGERYDLVLDVASNLSVRASKPLLKPDGFYVFIGHDHFGAAKGRVLGSIPRGLTLLMTRRFVHHLPGPGPTAPAKGEAMELLRGLLADGKLTPVVARTYPLEEVPQAIRHLQEGACGKIVVTP